MTKLGKQNINHYRNMLKLFFNYHKQYNEISQYINNDNKYSPVFAFITFKTILAR